MISHYNAFISYRHAEKDSKIESFIKKGEQLKIIGYDYLDTKGNVNTKQ